MRASDRFALDRKRISAEDWQAAMVAQGAFEQVDKTTQTDVRAGTSTLFPGPLDVWTGHSQGHRIVVTHNKGIISVDDPDEECIALLVELADLLAARVFGDRGEEYKDLS